MSSASTNDSLKLYQTIADEALIGFLVFDTISKHCVYANKLAVDLLEINDKEDLSKFKLSDLAPKTANFRKVHPFSEFLLNQEGLVQNVLVQKQGDHVFIANIGIKNVEIDGKNNVILMLQDMTVQSKLQREITQKQEAITQAYQELLEQNKQLKEMDVAKNRFIALTTHELRTPLSAMFASAEILKLKLYDDQEQHDEFVNMIYDQGNHMLELVNDILDFAKIQANRMDYFVEHKNLVDLVESQTEALQSMAEASKVSLKFSKPDHEILCYYDELRLRQVIANIVNNAIKYNREGGSVEIRLEHSDDKVTVFVKDTGKGIPSDQVAKVFDEFETLGKVAQHSKGTGLGMPISKRLIESMGGAINLESEVGVGSTFWIEVPKTKVLEEENYRSRPDTLSGDLAA